MDSDLNGASPQFTLTCISTGGPATTVTWTRDPVTFTNGTETVLDDPVTAQYTHTLTVTGRLLGLYTCTVANNKPSNDSSSYFGKLNIECWCTCALVHNEIYDDIYSFTALFCILLAENDQLFSYPPIPCSSPTSSAAYCGCGLHISNLHLPLLECAQWLSGDQFRGGVEEGGQWRD